ncbi:hypothetical protein ACFQS6_19695 [Xanthomonas populi]
MKVEILTGARKTAPNVRLVEPLKTEASTKAKTLGISLNALVSMAVRQYLDGEKPQVPAKPHDPLPQLVASSPGMRNALDNTRPAWASRQPGASAMGGRDAPCPVLARTSSVSKPGLVTRVRTTEVRSEACLAHEWPSFFYVQTASFLPESLEPLFSMST